ncbi:hypothetical protein ANCDUO_04625 [Ancylostoma duodenale]|uniref:Uncharacterized protein n=1 Tax=Ancylostoma duodenale TaxID=51022 RepID=A0A0C2GUG2_9BILA|nr:hypothetical protein ANCDUO_04625 [Ancylostoma duodenale]
MACARRVSAPRQITVVNVQLAGVQGDATMESALEASRATTDSVAHNVRITLCHSVLAETVPVVVAGLVRLVTSAADPHHS